MTHGGINTAPALEARFPHLGEFLMLGYAISPTAGRHSHLFIIITLTFFHDAAGAGVVPSMPNAACRPRVEAQQREGSL